MDENSSDQDATLLDGGVVPSGGEETAGHDLANPVPAIKVGESQTGVGTDAGESPLSADTLAPKPAKTEAMPAYVFWVQLGWLVGLIALLVLYQKSAGVRGWVPHRLDDIPVGALWFGAVGGSLISFGGIFKYNQNWDASYTYWHCVKPLLGAVSGGVGCVLLRVLLRTATSSTTLDSPDVFYAAGFIFGYGEAAFRELIRSITNIFIKPGTSNSGAGAGEDAKSS